VEGQLISAVQIHSAKFLWTSIAWMAWYLLAIAIRKKSGTEPEEALELAV
jgi:hypothetical protein